MELLLVVALYALVFFLTLHFVRKILVPWINRTTIIRKLSQDGFTVEAKDRRKLVVIKGDFKATLFPRYRHDIFVVVTGDMAKDKFLLTSAAHVLEDLAALG